MSRKIPSRWMLLKAMWRWVKIDTSPVPCYSTYACMRYKVDILVFRSSGSCQLEMYCVVSHFRHLLARVRVCCGFVVFEKCHCFKFIWLLSTGVVGKTDSFNVKVEESLWRHLFFPPIIIFQIMLDSESRNVTILTVLWMTVTNQNGIYHVTSISSF